MFYSQFILAKKGPLGTIWIAAHLERKLRKNQVADTDIGVSVDSILCPEVPIALRLSSHLLLGVVRIYSRKVNYLFHDCSEALLKIKQAFRSTAVDLPPEESTAPYHSITLPETFDLDDFELPDAVIQGNFVDHHVSTREQITLQDKVENTAYTSSQFGLDERFGDGDTSHINLDLDEELFLKKGASLSNASRSLENMEDQLSAQPETQVTQIVAMDIDGCQEDRADNKAVQDSTDIAETHNDTFCQPSNAMEDPTNIQAIHDGNFCQSNTDVGVGNSKNISTNSDGNLCQSDADLGDPKKISANSDGNLCQPSRAVGVGTNIPENFDRKFPNLSHERMTISDSANLQGYNIRTPDLNAVVFSHESTEGPDAMQTHIEMPCPANDSHPLDLLGPAQAPSTPGLLGESVPVHLQDASLSHQGKSSQSNDSRDTLTCRMEVDLEHNDLGSKIDDLSSLSQCTDLPPREVIDLQKDDNPCRIVNNEVLQEEMVGKTQSDVHANEHCMTGEAHDVKHNTGGLQHMEGAPLTSNVTIDNKVTTPRPLETDSILPVDNPEPLDSSQHKLTTALDSSPIFAIIASESDCTLQPCHSKDQLNSSTSEDQTIQYHKQSLLADIFAGDSMPKYDGPSSEDQGQSTTIPVRDGSAIILDHSVPYITGKRIPEADGSAHKYTTLSDSEQCPKTERPAVASTGLAFLINHGSSVVQATENATEASRHSTNFVHSEPERVMVSSTSTCSFTDSMQQYFVGKEVPESGGTAPLFPGLSGREYPGPERTILSSTGPPAISVNEGSLAADMIKNATQAGDHPAIFGYPEHEKVTTSTSPAVPAKEDSSAAHTAVNVTQACSHSSRVGYPELDKVMLTLGSPAVLENDGSLATRPMENAIQANFHSASFRCPDGQDPERVPLTSRDTSEVLASDSSLAAQANNRSASFGYMEPERVMLTSRGPSAVTASDGSLATQPTENAIQANFRSASFGCPDGLDPERMSWTSRGTPEVIANDGSLATQMAENTTQANNRSASFGYTEPERVMLTSRGRSVLPENDSSLAFQRTGDVTEANSLSACFGYREPGSVMVASTSTSSFIANGQQCIAGKIMPEPDGTARAYTHVSGQERYPEPERIMLASTSAHGLPNYMEQSTTWRSENAHSYHSLQGKELSFGEGTPTLFCDSTAKLSGPPRSKRKATVVPEDDDLLASILVGKKRASSSKAKDTSPLQLVPSSKRPRLSHKTGPKRKVLVDDTMILHGDTIRQQLMSTDDIRRMRKKAPCTHLETWMIQKLLLEDEIFTESILSGMSPELTSFQYVMCSRKRGAYHAVGSSHSPLHPSKMAPPKESEITPPQAFVESDNLTMAGQDKDANEMPVFPSSHLAVPSPIPVVHDVGIQLQTINTQDTARPTTEMDVQSNIHLVVERQHEPSHATYVQGVEDRIKDIQDTTQPTTEMLVHSDAQDIAWPITETVVHSNKYSVAERQHESAHTRDVQVVEDQTKDIQDMAQRTTEMPVHSNTQEKSWPITEMHVHSNNHLVVGGQDESPCAIDVQGLEDHAKSIQDTAQPSTEMYVHPAIKSQHEPSPVSAVQGVEDQVLDIQEKVQQTTEMPAHSNSPLVIGSQHKPSAVSVEHGLENHIMGAQETVNQEFLIDSVSQSVRTVEANNNDHQHDVKTSSTIGIDQCSISNPLPLEKENDMNASTVEKENDMNASTVEKENDLNASTVEKENDMNASTVEKENDMNASTVEKENDMNASTVEKENDMNASTVEKENDMNASTVEKENDMNASTVEKENDMNASTVEKENDMNASTMEKENDMSVSTVTMVDPSNRSFDESVHPNNATDPAENACSVKNGHHVSEGISDPHDVMNNTECPIPVMEEQHLHSQDSFEKAPDHSAPVESAPSSDGCPASENIGVIVDGVQLASASNTNEIKVREQQINAAADNKEMSPCEKSQSYAASDVIISAVGGVCDVHGQGLENDIPMENAEVGAAKDSCDLRSAVDENDHDTEFLNMDDGIDFDDEVDYDIPNPEEARLLENSGWSTRTRGVARYLKLLFDEETGYGKKDAQLDRLLDGKTRKEASRMFFETLVLKTKDYVHVEQNDSFGSIKIEPRSKLLKSTF